MGCDFLMAKYAAIDREREIRYGLGQEYLECEACNASGCSFCHDTGVIDWYPGVIEDMAKAREELKQRQYEAHVESLDKLPGAIRLFRTWKLYPNGDLGAMVANHIWQPGENVSLNDGSTAKENSGFYGFSKFEELKRQERDWWDKSQFGTYDATFNGRYSYVCGTILGYGHCKVAEKGARVQKAVPEYIIEPNCATMDFGMVVVNAAEKYGMRIVTLSQVEDLDLGIVRYWKGRQI